MADWKQTLDIKKVLKLGPELDDGDTLPYNIRAAMKTEIGRVRENLRDEYYDDLVEELGELSTVAELNSWLDDMYDWANRNRIWLGAI